MIFNAHAIVLARRPSSEYDRLSTIFTENHGKMTVRFVGVTRPLGKLKALSEPIVWGEYRLHLSPRTQLAKCIGGGIVASFPAVRSELSRTLAALYCAELLNELTVDRAPSPESFRLLASTLTSLEASPSRWLTLAFGLRLLEISGFGLREKSPRGAEEVWSALHRLEPSQLTDVPFDAAVAAEARQKMEAHIESQIDRPLKTVQFRRSLAAARAVEGVPAR
jgi:DNA repair protein RecO (recombination protein O)